MRVWFFSLKRKSQLGLDVFFSVINLLLLISRLFPSLIWLFSFYFSKQRFTLRLLSCLVTKKQKFIFLVTLFLFLNFRKQILKFVLRSHIFLKCWKWPLVENVIYFSKFFTCRYKISGSKAREKNSLLWN